MAEAVLSAILEPLLSKLTSKVLDEYARITGISKKLKEWKGAMDMIQAVMDSAEERQMRGDPQVDLWLTNLQDVAYDMEDLVDLFTAEARLRDLKAKTKSAKLPSWLIARCSKMNPCTLLSHHHMANEIDEVNRRLDEVINQKSQLGLAMNYTSQPPANANRPRFTTTSVPEPMFVGREAQIDKLLARLTGGDLANDSIKPFIVISIVGMGGLGKTTLAQQLYNHETVREAFPIRAWTCVSDIFDRFVITKSILQSMAPSIDCKEKDLNWLENSLKDQLTGKKFLIVLDDVWNENYHELNSLLKPFCSGSRGSRIIVTTRSSIVAERAGDRDPRILDSLSSDECLSLLACHAIGKPSFDDEPRLGEIAVQLAEKCGGLPLAAMTIGGLLSFNSDYEEWKKVSEHEIWKREDKDDTIPRALKLSYIHLPIRLKRCFAACAIFPKDHLFDMDELIHLWIVHDLLQKETKNTYRNVGIEYFYQLEARSLLQKAKEGEEPRYSMHDLVNDLAKSVGGITYYSSEDGKGPSNGKNLERIRHAAFTLQSEKGWLEKEVSVCRSMKKLRTLTFSGESYDNIDVASTAILNKLIMDWKCLRILWLRGIPIDGLPERIGDLKLLRSIDLSYTSIKLLPESTCDLIDLEYLLLQGCQELKKLPTNIHKLTKLLCLDLTGSNNLWEMPPHIGRLINLETLPLFVVGEGTGQGLKELGPLKGIRGKLHIRELWKVDAVGDARNAKLSEKEGISELVFDWGARDDQGIIREDKHNQLNILEQLRPPRKIKRLKISDYGGKTFPSWFGNPCIDNVMTITMSSCISVESLPPLGRLPALKTLFISNLVSLSRIGDELFGTTVNPFPSLLYLSFSDMPAWKEWSYREDYPENGNPFPCLKKLYLRKCHLLKGGLPGRLDALSELVIRGCPLLETSGESLSLPSLLEIDIEDCNNAVLNCLVKVTSMTRMTIKKVPQLVRFDRRFSTYWVSLEQIIIYNCSGIESLLDGDFGEQLPLKLKSLKIQFCDDLKKLPDDLGSLPSLTDLTVKYCANLSSFPSSGFPPTLRTLDLDDCSSLPLSQLLSMRLPPAIKELTLDNLKGVVTSDTDDEFTGGHSSPSLTTTSPPDCFQHLSSLPQLEVLVLDDLHGLKSITDVIAGGNFPKSLRRLEIHRCYDLTTLPDCLRHLSCLSQLSVEFCRALEMDCFPSLPSTLSELYLVDCPEVKSLPRDMRHLTSLKKLTVRDCEGITCFPSGGLPPNLESLDIGFCENLNQPLEDWGLSDLPALRELVIVRGIGCMDQMVLFPSSAAGSNAWSRALPSSLVSLEISWMEVLEGLAVGLRNHLTSLQTLRIDGCEKMRFLPEDGLPDSLEFLQIIGCPLLRERCSEKHKGEYWPLLQHIPDVFIE